MLRPVTPVLRSQADDMIDVIVMELRLRLRDKSAESQRRVMRTYGVEFAYFGRGSR